MTEREAQEILLGKPPEDRILSLVYKALQRKPIEVVTFQGRVELNTPTGCYGLVLFVPREDS